MLDLIGHHLESGESMEDSPVNYARRRLRPILMTSLATVLAMLPLAYGIGHGSDMLRPLAIGKQATTERSCGGSNTHRHDSAR